MTKSSHMAIAFSAGCVRRSLIMAFVVGPILTVINQGGSLISEVPFDVWKAALTFVVPYVVATVSAVATQQSNQGHPAPCQAEEPPLGSARAGQGRPADSEAAPLKARIYVTLKPGVLDPQGKAIANALDGLGFAGIGEVRQGKVIDLVLDERDPGKARASVEAMCQKLLANTVIEDYAIELEA